MDQGKLPALIAVAVEQCDGTDLPLWVLIHLHLATKDRSTDGSARPQPCTVDARLNLLHIAAVHCTQTRLVLRLGVFVFRCVRYRQGPRWSRQGIGKAD